MSGSERVVDGVRMWFVFLSLLRRAPLRDLGAVLQKNSQPKSTLSTDADERRQCRT